MSTDRIAARGMHCHGRRTHSMKPQVASPSGRRCGGEPAVRRRHRIGVLVACGVALSCASPWVRASIAEQPGPVAADAAAEDALAPGLARMVRATLRQGADGIDAVWRTLQHAAKANDGHGFVLRDGTRLASFDHQKGRDGGVATIELALPQGGRCLTSQALRRAALASADDAMPAPTWMARVNTFETPRGGVFHSFRPFDVAPDGCIDRIYLWRKPVDDLPYYDVDGDGKVLGPDFEDRTRWRLARAEPPPLHGDELGDRPPPDICFVDDIRSQVAFEPGSAELAPCAKRILEETADASRRYPDIRFVVAGHADVVEMRGDGEALSLRRARTAYDYLLQKGVPASNVIDVVGHGNRRPHMQEDVDAQAGAQDNRRVDLDVRSAE